MKALRNGARKAFRRLVGLPPAIDTLTLPDPRTWADQLEPPVAALEAALQHRSLSVIAATGSRGNNEDRLAAARRDLRLASALLMAFYRFAGFECRFEPLRKKKRRASVARPAAAEKEASASPPKRVRERS